MRDSNGTRHHLVLGHTDWLRLALPLPGAAAPAGAAEAAGTAGAPWAGTAFDRTGEQLTLAPRAMVAPAWPPGETPDVAGRGGAAVDANGNIYWINAGRTAVIVQAAADGTRSTFWSQTSSRAAPEPTPGGGFGVGPDAAPAAGAVSLILRGLTVTTEEYLVAGAADPAGLVIFDLRSSDPPTRRYWPPALACSPLQLAATPDGGLLVLDLAAGHPRYWRLNRAFDVVSGNPAPATRAGAGGFMPVSPPSAGEPSLTEPLPIAGQAVPLTGTPVALTLLPSGTVLVLGAAGGGEPSTVSVYTDDAFTGDRLTLGPDDDGKAIQATTMVSEPARSGGLPSAVGQVYVVSATRMQAHEFGVTETAAGIEIRRTARHLPLRGYGDGGLASTPAGPVYMSGDRWVPLATQPQSLYETGATVTIGPLDGGEPGCIWHRLILDAVLPPRCRVSVQSRAADDQPALAAASFRAEPALAVRPYGSEEPYLTLPDAYSTSETLFQAATGRWLQLQLQLEGDGRTTPKLRAVRIYYPRFSYLRNYLPAVYRSNPSSASFVDRFLANVEGINTNIEDLIAAAQMLLDPRSVPAGALDWLAGFFAVALDPSWTDAKRRLFLAHVMDFFAWRGTVRGLQVAVRLALDPAVDENLFASPADAQTLAYRVVELFNNPLPGTPSAAATAQPVGPARRARVAPAAVPPPGTAAAESADPAQWHEFLTLRYQRLAALNAAYTTGGPYAGFADVPLPAAAPTGGAELADWLDFTTVVAPTSGLAHRFTMLVPRPLSAASDPADIDPGGLRALARRIVELNKPAHTVCDIQYYWSAFQVGGAQLGNSTVLDVGSRAPQLLVPAQLGRDYAGAGYLGGAAAPYLRSTPSVGRDTTLDS